jgi:DNA topoisomerase-1
MLKLGKKADGTKYTAEDLADVPLDDVKKMIEAQLPNAFNAKAKKAAPKKAAAKKAVPKKAAAKKKAK